MLKIQLVGLLTMLRKEWSRLFRIWAQTILPSLITITLYFLIFGNFIGTQIKQMQGFRYIDFIVPGLIMMAIITNSYTNVVTTVFSAKFQKNIEELLVSPLYPSTILLGYLSGGVLRGFLVGVLITLISLFFSPLSMERPFFILVTMILTTLLFSLLGFINGLFAKKFDDVSIVPTFILTPLTYLGGVFYSLSFLPPFWQKVSLFNPILYLVNAFRFGFLGHSDVPVELALFILFFFIIILWFLCLGLVKKGFGLRL